ncbi:MAG: hypothetical protein EI684_02325 [Candidatus Viridilinea halotolerans]|uniref:DNA methylase adenine-specific domain-containing protein n=1 Tax=Candidatus Viridilinea halotolerans TaxID=2491704 RepID=A0A426U9I4_9CHLR|nr:MAG: hypothetical protein EI684_02325 [Candidatus Viridilinea halotolerans]
MSPEEFPLLVRALEAAGLRSSRTYSQKGKIVIDYTAIDSVVEQIAGVEPRRYDSVYLPDIAQGEEKPLVAAIWTSDGQAPHWDNLAIAMGEITESQSEDRWKRVINSLSLPLTILDAGDNRAYLTFTTFSDNEIKRENIAREEVVPLVLAMQQRAQLFSPAALARLKRGQLSFGDLEHTLALDSFAYLSKQRAVLNEALKSAINAVMQEISTRRRHSEGASNIRHVVSVTIAYLAARILEDKGFFGRDRLPTNDVERLLYEVTQKTNGFFAQTFQENLDHLPPLYQQILARYLGHQVSFALINHHDVGLLYEELNNLLWPWLGRVGISGEALPPQLQQHYTPIGIAHQMLAHLPLERIAPEERIIYDPAAGSGTLLLAATLRLAQMRDMTQHHDARTMLANAVMGNDRDPWARLMTELRYRLIDQVMGANDLLLAPKHFTNFRYEEDPAWDMPRRPRVIVANPPYAVVEKKQTAVRFLKLALSKLNDKDQFAFVLPQILFTSDRYAWPTVRTLFAEECQIFDTWLLPEGVVGLRARQSVSVIIGQKGGNRQHYSIARRVISSAESERIQTKGFLGEAWIAQLPQGASAWQECIAPGISIGAPTVTLSSLFEVHSGVRIKTNLLYFANPPADMPFQAYWKFAWKRPDTLLADPRFIPDQERFIPYTKEFLLRPMFSNEHVFRNSCKILVSRNTNWNADEPMPVRMDLTGLCPNDGGYCVIPFSNYKLDSGVFPAGWHDLTDEERLFWCLGILRSDIGQDLSMRHRSPRSITKPQLQQFPLPRQVDPKIIELVRSALLAEQKEEVVLRGAHGRHEALHRERWPLLNRLVQEAYQIEHYIPGQRTGASPSATGWKSEVNEPSIPVTARVTEVDLLKNRVRLVLDSLTEEAQEGWITLPQNLPGWALEGVMFSARVSKSIQALEDLDQRPWALHHLQHRSRAYMSLRQLQEYFLNRERQNYGD